MEEKGEDDDGDSNDNNDNDDDDRAGVCWGGGAEDATLLSVW